MGHASRARGPRRDVRPSPEYRIRLQRSDSVCRAKATRDMGAREQAADAARVRRDGEGKQTLCRELGRDLLTVIGTYPRSGTYRGKRGAQELMPLSPIRRLPYEHGRASSPRTNTWWWRPRQGDDEIRKAGNNTRRYAAASPTASSELTDYLDTQLVASALGERA